ncbi:MAG: hypothetical protein IJN43_03995 [Ruminococcus sp.]|nr:hypothetical protein [Ruminococcus sp.]
MAQKSKEELFNELKQRAKQGNKEAQYLVGEKYWFDGEKTNAKYFLRKAAKENHSDAQFLLGKILYEERSNNEDEAMHWICCAHINGNPKAANYMNKKLDEYEAEISESVAEINYNLFNRKVKIIKKYGIDYETVCEMENKHFWKTFGIILAIMVFISILVTSCML